VSGQEQKLQTDRSTARGICAAPAIPALLNLKAEANGKVVFQRWTRTATEIGGNGSMPRSYSHQLADERRSIDGRNQPILMLVEHGLNHCTHKYVSDIGQ